MENKQEQKTPLVMLVILASFILFTTLPSIVLVNAGLIQFKIVELVGPQNVTAMYSLAAGISGVAVVIMNPFGGFLADRTKAKFGRRRTWIVLGTVLGGLSMLLIAHAPSLPVLIIAYILMQFFYGMVFLSCYAMVPEQIEPEKFGKVSGIFGAVGPLGIMVGFMLEGPFANVPVEQKIIVIAGIQFIVSILSVLLLKDNPYEGKTNENKKFAINIKKIYPSVKKYPNFTWALFTKLFMSMANSSLNIMSIFYLTRFHMNQAGVMQMNSRTSLAIVLLMIAGVVGGFLSDKIRKQKIFVIGSSLFSGICLIGFAFTNSLDFVVIATFAFNFSYGLFGAVDNALVNRVLPSKEDTGKDIAIINTTTQLGSAIVSFATPTLLAIGVSTIGGDGYQMYFIAVAITTVLAALTVLPIPELGAKEVSAEKEIAAE